MQSIPMRNRLACIVACACSVPRFFGVAGFLVPAGPLRSHILPTTVHTPILRKDTRPALDLKATQDEDGDIVTDANDTVQAVSGIDLDREAFRLESFGAYVLVSALISTTSLSTLVFFMPIDDPEMQLTWPDNILCLLTQMTSVYCTMSSLLATVVFSLEELYGKSALGIKRDKIYVDFVEKTAQIRILGFKAFLSSLVIFSVQAGLVATERVRGVPSKTFVALLSAVGFFFIVSVVAEIVKDASPLYDKSSDE
jgi:hypothetical protein